MTRPGTDAEYVSVPDAWLSPEPARLSMGEAAAVPLPYGVAWWAVVKTGMLTAGAEATLDAPAFYRRRLRLTGVNMTAVTGPDVRNILNELNPGFESGALHAPTTRAWPLTEAKSAFEAVAAGTDGVKEILLPGEELSDVMSAPQHETKGTLHE